MRASRLRRASTALLVAGAALVADAVLTVVWQEPLSAIYTAVRQSDLRDRLAALGVAQLTPLEQRALARLGDEDRRLAFLARSLRARSADGDPMGRVVIPAIDVDVVIVEGTAPGDLRQGPGHYGSTPLPGLPGTVALAGHRTTYGAPFRDLDDLGRRDEIRLEMPYGRFVYRVDRTRIVEPEAVAAIRPLAYDRVVLTACHPLYSAKQRIVVSARLVRTEPADLVRIPARSLRGRRADGRATVGVD